jgi:hypothetical protein
MSFFLSHLCLQKLKNKENNNIQSKGLIKLKVENAFFFSENAEIFIKERQKKDG